jgi:hypothetical protein
MMVMSPAYASARNDTKTADVMIAGSTWPSGAKGNTDRLKYMPSVTRLTDMKE